MKKRLLTLLVTMLLFMFTAIMPASAATVTYDVDKAIAYAHAHCDRDAYSTFFRNYKSIDSDCINFVSQCLWFAFGGKENAASIANKSWPMNENWHQTKSGTSTATWTGCKSFYNYFKADNAGPFGTWYEGVSKAMPGDIIIVSTNGGKGWAHVMLVTRVSGEYGKRTMNDIMVCGHTRTMYDHILGWDYDPSYTYHTIHPEGIKK